MKSSRIMKIFEQYVRKYDMNNVNIKSRYFHSLKVMEIAKELATGLGIFTEEEIETLKSGKTIHVENLWSEAKKKHYNADLKYEGGRIKPMFKKKK